MTKEENGIVHIYRLTKLKEKNLIQYKNLLKKSWLLLIFSTCLYNQLNSIKDADG